MIKKACQALCVCIFLITGCGQDNSRTGSTASGEPTVLLPFEVALPEGYTNDKVIAGFNKFI